MSRWRLLAQALITLLLVVACGSATPASTATPDAIAEIPSVAPSASAAPTPTPAPTATATPSPTPSPTPEPWKTYTSKRIKYTIKYPPDWTVDPGDKDHLDAFDSYAEARFYVGHAVESFRVDLADFVRQDIAYYKSKFKAKVVSNKSIKLAGGYVGRIVEFLGTEDGVKVSISHVLVVKGRSWYELNFWLDEPATSPGRELFPEIYGSWRPTS